MKRLVLFVLLGALLGACGPLHSGDVVTISGLMFSPTVVSAAPGATITVDNRDPFAHTFTSEAAQNAYVPGRAGNVSFDTGPFMGTTTITIPSNAVIGTNVWFYCRVHTTMMNQGYIHVVAPGGMY